MKDPLTNGTVLDVMAYREYDIHGDLKRILLGYLSCALVANGAESGGIISVEKNGKYSPGSTLDAWSVFYDGKPLNIHPNQQGMGARAVGPPTLLTLPEDLARMGVKFFNLKR